MSTIIVAMPKIEDAKKISDMLISRGIGRIEICTTGNLYNRNRYFIEGSSV